MRGVHAFMQHDAACRGEAGTLLRMAVMMTSLRSELQLLQSGRCMM